MDKFLEHLAPKAFTNLHFVAVLLWIVIGGTFLAVFVDMDINEPRASLNRSFMQDSKFLKTYLNSYLIKSYKKFIKRMRDTITEETQELLELQSPFSDNPGEKITAVKHLTMDQIYTNLVLIQDRDEYKFPKNREEQLKVYPWSRDETSCPKKLKDLLNKDSNKVLIIGRPGIGKTFYCTKLIRDWASGAEKHFDAAFFVKFRRFDSADELSLRELLMKSEYFPTHHLDDEVCCQLLENPKDVLILFDGFDEFRHDQHMESTYPRGIDEKKPLQILYQALVKGILLKGASVLTTTRPTALSSIKYLSQSFDKTLEVLGFSWEQIKKYVENFAGKDKQTRQTLWRHISSNLNLLSLCYVPVNSFIICSSLYPILQSNSSAGVSLPSRLTTIYKIAVKVFYFKRTREVPKKYLTSELFESDDLPDEVPEEFEKLGKVAFDGIKEGKLILGENEVRGIEDSALFHRLPDQRLNHGSLNREKQFCFIHLTMQEFFAAWHLTNKMNETELPTFVFENIQDGKWQLVFQFLAGLMDDKENQQFEIFTHLFPVKTEESESERYNEDWPENQEKTKVTCWPTENGRELAVTLLKCINETSKMNTAVQRKLEQSNFNCVDFNHCHLTAVDCSSLVNVMENVRGISHFDLSGNNTGPLAAQFGTNMQA
ncbi:NACHT, LRR and PYD domains-containing protein 3 [Stylophora pistillata]|uniref:NACHT, LRR and PYD domains-containing protein 3 n=1 Tax=Stylophora pistillata TaxID=50429 RepID=A0A2B4RHK0_STYPI|nr:NACHT, LRR and PYD domains-containing protein 3 [Stylophora pistillata]